jgi:hypothetical protein
MNSSTADRHIPELHQMQREIAALLLYQDVLSDEIGVAFIELLHAIAAGDRSRGNTLACLTAYGKLFRALSSHDYNWGNYLIDRILRAENPFSLKAQKANLDNLSPALVKAAHHDLQSLQTIYQFGQHIPTMIQQAIASSAVAIDWSDTEQLTPPTDISLRLAQMPNWGDAIADLAEYYHQFGVGIFGEYRAFRWQGKLIGIPHPDPIKIHSLVGYSEQKAKLVQNTEFLLAGYPALNILLYGGKGTGKSSLVKGLLNYYPQSQLRLIEVSKSALIDLPQILDLITDLPQKFIIFVDDLSFEEDDEAFKSLKVVLEGSVTAKPQNVVVYATSNRRHLVREYFADRPRPIDADEIHHWDTVQEKLSFSDRFGFTLTFEPADQDKYLAIVAGLAADADLTISAEDLRFRALQWATRHNGRSGRTARQFIDYLRAELALM